jgi:hypothetical protein
MFYVQSFFIKGMDKVSNEYNYMTMNGKYKKI